MASNETGHGVMHEYYGSPPYHRYVASMYVHIHMYVYIHIYTSTSYSLQHSTQWQQQSSLKKVQESPGIFNIKNMSEIMTLYFNYCTPECKIPDVKLSR